MALIVEDGTGLADADSYISLIDARTYAASYGYTLDVDDTKAEVQLRQAFNIVNTHNYKGEPLNGVQAGKFPRINLECNDYVVDIPTQLLKAGQAQVVYADAINSGVIIRGNNDGKRVIEETVVGAVSVKYDKLGADSSNVEIQAAEDILACYFSNIGGLCMKVVRK